MLQSLRYSNLFLRFGLVIVFVWFGVDKFMHPDYWLNAWVPQGILAFVEKTGITGRDFIYLNGIFEVLVGASLLTNVFIRWFSFAAALFLVTILSFHLRGFNEVIVRDIGLLGGFLALIFWPDRRYS